MGALFSILRYSIGSLTIGIVIALAGTVLMFLLIKGWYKNAMMSPITYVVGILLFILLAAQSIMICGAITTKSYSENIHAGINRLVNDLSSDAVLSEEDSQAILNEIKDSYPLIGYYISSADFTGHTPTNIADAMVSELRSCLNWYIIRHLLWCLGFVVVGVFVGIKSLSSTRSTTVRTHTSSTAIPRSGERKSRYSSRRRY